MENVIYTSAQLRPLQVICVALPAGLVLFSLVAIGIQSDGPPVTDLTVLAMLRLAHVVIFAVALFAQKALFARILSGKMSAGARSGGSQSFLSRYRTSMIVRLALIEGAALFGLVILVIASTGGVLNSDPTLYLHLIPVLLLIAIARTSFPTQQKLVELERQLQA